MSRVGVTQAKENEAVCTHLSLRGKNFYIRRRIPTELIEHYGRKEIVRSLGTSNRKEAERLCRIEGVKLDHEFASVRALHASVIPVDSGTITARFRSAGHDDSYVEREGWLDPIRQPADGQSVDVEAMASRRLAKLRRQRDEAAMQGYEALTSFMARQRSNLENQEAFLDGDFPPMYSLSVHEAWRNALRTFHGKVLVPQESCATESTSTSTRSRITGAGTPLASIVEKWAAERKPDAQTIRQATQRTGTFVDLVGAIPVELIEPQHAVTFKNKMLESGQSAVNTNHYLTTLTTLLNFAKNDLLLVPSNPFAGIRLDIRKNAKERVIAFDLPALKAIFASPIYTGGTVPAGGKGAAAYWLPLLALFTGARAEELCQLRPEDVYEDRYYSEGDAERTVWVVAITDRGDDAQGLKNEGSRRRFPIHAELLRLGFVEFAVAAKGRSRLFDKLEPDVRGRESGNWLKWFGKYLRSVCGVTDTRMVFHSFRHTFKDAARASMQEPESDAITGHSSGKVGRRYGGLTYPLAPLVDAMARYRIPGLIVHR